MRFSLALLLPRAAVPGAGARPPRRAALALLPLVPRTRTTPPPFEICRASTHGRPTNERCDVRSAGVADWKTARGGNTERTLTAAARPPPRDPYRHSLTMRPPRKARPFCFFRAVINEDPNRVLVGFGGFWRALAGFGGLWRVLSGFIRFYRVFAPRTQSGPRRSRGRRRGAAPPCGGADIKDQRN